MIPRPPSLSWRDFSWELPSPLPQLGEVFSPFFCEADVVTNNASQRALLMIGTIIKSSGLFALFLIGTSLISPAPGFAQDDMDDDWGESESVVLSGDDGLPSQGAGWNRHKALCHGSANCTVTFSDDGLRAGSLEIPSSRLAGWSAVDKSQSRCNMFGVCYRNKIFDKERQEFTISYINDKGKKSKILIAFVNAKAAVNFKQDIDAFAQLAKATKGRRPVEILSDADASKDLLTSTSPAISSSVHFSTWIDVGVITSGELTWQRFIAPSKSVRVAPGVFEYPTMRTSEGMQIIGAGRIDCRRSLVSSHRISSSGIDSPDVTGWTMPRTISPSDMAFTAAKTLCK